MHVLRSQSAGGADTAHVPSRTCTPTLPASLPLHAAHVPVRLSRHVRAHANSGAAGQFQSQNPLEALRGCRDINKRCALIQELDRGWREAHEQYVPSPAEECVIKELGLWKSTVMYLAVQTDLASWSPDEQVRPAIRCLKQANLEPQDIWLLMTKRLFLFCNPVQLQRWLDFLAVLQFGTRDLLNFFMRAPEALLSAYTIHSASQVVKYLRELGIKDDHLKQRILAICPSVLTRSVDQDIKPTISLLTSLGVEISDVSGIICMWPGILVADTEAQLKPWVAYVQSELGCSHVQVGEIISASPHLLGSDAKTVFGDRVRALRLIGISKEDMSSIVSKSTLWLKTSSNVQELLDFLQARAGFTREQVRTLVIAAPGLLSLKPLDLERKWRWMEQIGATREQVLECPQAIEAGLVSVLGPRHGFLDGLARRRRDLERLRQLEPEQQQQQPVQDQSLPMSEAQKQQQQKQHQGSVQGRSLPLSEADSVDVSPIIDVQLPLLVEPAEDEAWCERMGVGLSDFKGFKGKFEEEYLKSMTRSSAMEFQDELKRLGIYEGE